MRRILMIVIACLFLIQSNAQILYEISGNGLKNNSYLFGTNQFVATSSIVEINNIFKCFNDCQTVVGEIVVDEEEMSRKMLKIASMHESITEFLTPEEESLVDSALRAELNLSLLQVGHMRPAMIENIYKMTAFERLFSRKEEDSQMDSFFQRAAIELNKSIFGLETVDEQLKFLFKTQSLEKQAENLVKTINGSYTIREDMNKLNQLYLSGDIYSLYDWIVKKEGYSEADKFLLIDEKNTEWVEKINKYIKRNSCFVAIDAIHLPGRLGMVELLRKKGYHVKPVK